MFGTNKRLDDLENAVFFKEKVFTWLYGMQCYSEKLNKEKPNLNEVKDRLAVVEQKITLLAEQLGYSFETLAATNEKLVCKKCPSKNQR